MSLKSKILFLLFLILTSCNYPTIIRDDLVYENNFENKTLDFIDGGEIINYNDDTNLLGNFNNDGFTIHLDDLGNHDYVFISFDLYIHGTWDGNSNGFSVDDKPDKWILEINPDMSLHNDPSSNKFVTTFSNSPCWPDYCLVQSFPSSYPSVNNPKNGAYKFDMPSVDNCRNSFFGGLTTLYKFEKTFRSSGNAVIIRMYDELYQPNAIDQYGQNQQKCDESWSIDNLKIRVIEYK